MFGSLLLIAAVWLVLLAPLLLRNQKPVRRTAQALGETRVLHRGGSALKAKRKLKPAEGLYMASDDDELELVEAEPEYVLLEDEDSATKASKSRGLRAFMANKGSSSADDAADVADADDAADAAEVVDGEVVDAADTADSADSADDVDGDVEEASEGEDKVVAAEANATKSKAVRYTTQDEMDTGEFEPIRDVAEAAEAAEAADAADSEYAAAAAAEDTDSDTDKDARQRAYASVPAEYVRGGDVKASPDLVDDVDEAPRDKSIDILMDSDELSEDDLKYLAARRGRGVYDPVASAALARQRQNRRKKVLFVLLALSALTFGMSMYLGGTVWLSFVAMIGFTAFYLVMLRRQAIEERELRHRRLVRMRRARLGVRNTEDNELGVPDRLVRPGAVILETDEVDPAFSNLEYADGSDFFDLHEGTHGTSAAPAAGTRSAVVDGDEEFIDPRSGIRAV
ncbi:hypothetical protein QQA05_08300 [Corynebacterium macclintockiae]|uniref:divisome protein SepX/GlpR n=1 Tax=Corynebacterium macclintockiae TaxID=2913501 RepID=UPI0025508653|nr:gephyrin-like molybdotransferase receptor GlpR [Corynebacterium macclintockiae]MDK8891391.1 hypothetical protein [Corynebacterium macclintockiae]